MEKLKDCHMGGRTIVTTRSDIRLSPAVLNSRGERGLTLIQQNTDEKRLEAQFGGLSKNRVGIITGPTQHQNLICKSGMAGTLPTTVSVQDFVNRDRGQAVRVMRPCRLGRGPVFLWLAQLKNAS